MHIPWICHILYFHLLCPLRQRKHRRRILKIHTLFARFRSRKISEILIPEIRVGIQYQRDALQLLFCGYVLIISKYVFFKDKKHNYNTRHRDSARQQMFEHALDIKVINHFHHGTGNHTAGCHRNKC